MIKHEELVQMRNIIRGINQNTENSIKKDIKAKEEMIAQKLGKNLKDWFVKEPSVAQV